MAYQIEFAESVQTHLRALTARERAIVLDTIERQLLHEPLKETRHRKPLRPNPIAPWELRIGSLRVFYEVTGEETAMVARRYSCEENQPVLGRPAACGVCGRIA